MKQTVCDICGAKANTELRSDDMLRRTPFDSARVSTGRGDFLGHMKVEILADRRADLCDECWKKLCMIAMKKFIERYKDKMDGIPDALEFKG